MRSLEIGINTEIEPQFYCGGVFAEAGNPPK